MQRCSGLHWLRWKAQGMLWWTYVATVLSGAAVQVAPHLKTRLLEPSFLKLEEHGAGAPWSLADGSIWQHTRLWLHPDVPNVFGSAFSEASVTSRHVSVEASLNFTHSDFLLPDSYVATWLVPMQALQHTIVFLCQSRSLMHVYVFLFDKRAIIAEVEGLQSSV